MNEMLTMAQIRAAYPDEWVLIGNPVLGEAGTVGSVVSKLQRGLVLYHSKDKREIAYKAKELTHDVDQFTCVFTGETITNRRFWL